MRSFQGCHFPWRSGNRFELLVDGPAFFQRMLEAIDSAQRFILLEMYLIESGVVAERFITALLTAAERGVRIYLLLDDFGAAGLRQTERDKLQQGNIHIVYFNPLHSHSTLYNLYLVFWRRLNRYLYRNHRKLLLVDGRVAFTGGAGITDEFDPPGKSQLRWRETMVGIQGPVLHDWQQLFVDCWNRYSGAPLILEPATPEAKGEGQLGRVLVNEVGRRPSMSRELSKRIQRSRERVWFATAYFLPSWRIRRSLTQAARAGVDVRLLVPGPITDHPGVRYASHRYYGRLLAHGIRIFEYQPCFLHQKMVLCDTWVSVGSSNFDRWNMQWNLEANQAIDDKIIAESSKAIFETDFANSREVSRKAWHERSWWWRVNEWFWRRVELISLKIKDR